MNKSIREQLEDLILEAQLRSMEEMDVSKDMLRGYCAIEVRRAESPSKFPEYDEQRALVYAKHHKA